MDHTFGLYVLFTIAIKPTHFFLPILLPAFSSLVVLFEFPPFTGSQPRQSLSWLWLDFLCWSSFISL
jgi:hypothetical protein